MPYLPDSTAYFFALTHMFVSLILYSFWFAAAVEKWVPLALPISMGEHDNILPWSVSKIIQIKLRDKLDPVIAGSQTIEFKDLCRPTSADFSTVPTVRYLYFFSHTKLLNETDGCFFKNTMYPEISFFDPPIPPTHASLLFLLPVRHPITFNNLSVG